MSCPLDVGSAFRSCFCSVHGLLKRSAGQFGTVSVRQLSTGRLQDVDQITERASHREYKRLTVSRMSATCRSDVRRFTFIPSARYRQHPLTSFGGCCVVLPRAVQSKAATVNRSFSEKLTFFVACGSHSVRELTFAGVDRTLRSKLRSVTCQYESKRTPWCQDNHFPQSERRRRKDTSVLADCGRLPGTETSMPCC